MEPHVVAVLDHMLAVTHWTKDADSLLGPAVGHDLGVLRAPGPASERLVEFCGFLVPATFHPHCSFGSD